MRKVIQPAPDASEATPPALKSTVPGVPGRVMAYAPRPLSHHRRLIRRWFAIGTAVFTIAAVGPHLVGPVRRRVQLVYWQHQCMDSSPVGQDIVSNGGWTLPVTLVSPPWHRLATLLIENPRSRWTRWMSTLPPSNTVFVHERTRPDGRVRLVVVDVGNGYNGKVPDAISTIAQINSRVIVPGSLFREPLEVPSDYSFVAHVALHAGDTVMAGVIDPSDPAHFTIPVRRGATVVKIDGWLKDDDTVVFNPKWVWMQ